MPPRDARLRVDDILTAIGRIETYTTGMTFDAFAADQKTIDAVVRNFEVIGEAARHFDERLAQRAPDVPWNDIRDMRNILIHAYFGVDVATVWKTIVEDLTPLRENLRSLRNVLDP